MLWFLHMARLEGLTVTAYSDTAEGTLSDIAPGRQSMTRIVLHPRIEWLGPAPDQARLDRLHHDAHENCFIANSLRTTITIA